MTLRLTTYFGERDHDGRRFLAEALLDTYARHGVEVSALMRGAAGFGAKHHLHTDTLLTLSEDLPMVSVAIDTRERIEALIGEVERLRHTGLVTVESTQLLDGRAVIAEPAKLTLISPAGGGPTRRPATCSTATAWRARPCCMAWTAPSTASAGARRAHRRSSSRSATALR